MVSCKCVCYSNIKCLAWADQRNFECFIIVILQCALWPYFNFKKEYLGTVKNASEKRKQL